jgi:hypothetical protein
MTRRTRNGKRDGGEKSVSLSHKHDQHDPLPTGGRPRPAWLQANVGVEIHKAVFNASLRAKSNPEMRGNGGLLRRFAPHNNDGGGRWSGCLKGFDPSLSAV